ELVAERQLVRFKRELEVIAQLHHPHIVRLLDGGELEDGRRYAVLELIEGESLAAILAHGDKPLEPPEAMRLMSQVLDALLYAHKHGVIHRDLKPENIMVTGAEPLRNVKVVDFGLAAIMAEARSESATRVTATGELAGTPLYMSPEQLRGHPVTPATDIYAWGLTFIECLTGRSAVGGGSAAEVIFRVLSPDPIRLPHELRGHRLGSVIGRAVAKAAKDRFATAAEALEELR